MESPRPPNGSSATVTFQIVDGVDKGRVFRDLPVPLTIGREEGNLLRLNDERVSRFHAKIQQDGNDLILTDLESTIVLDPANAPLPDFAVVRSGDLLGRAAPERYPGPRDVGLLIEVAVTSLHDDLTTTLEQYARALIRAYWVVDIPGRRILVHTEPRVVDGKGEYARVETFRPGQSLPLVLDGQEVALIPFDEFLR